MITIVGFIEERIDSTYNFLVPIGLEPRADILALLGLSPPAAAVRPVSPPRGLPPGVSSEVLAAERRTHASNRCHTWLTPQDLQEAQDRFRDRHGIRDVALQDVLDLIALAGTADLRVVLWLSFDQPRVHTPREQHDCYGSAG